ncbi:hypothetical protein VDG1235_3658 [Verrucomicrobiia bacterium DG1235]|nr:hypothetical protein VDG1235_3658 [Verrucomicrobiae bacterium DG1235]
MRTFAKPLFTLLATILFAGSAFSKSVDVVEPDIVGLYFYASWCSSCKVLDPHLEVAKKSLKKSPFLLVKMDVSNKVTQHQAGMMAATMGYDEVYKKTGLKTGFIILVDTATGEEIERITKEDDAAAIASKIKALTEA